MPRQRPFPAHGPAQRGQDIGEPLEALRPGAVPLWWISPHAALYSDPIYKKKVRGLPRSEITGGIAFSENLSRLDPDSDLVVALDRPDAVDHVGRLLWSRFRIRRLALKERSPSFAFLIPAYR